MLKFIAPLLALIGLIGLGTGTTETGDSGSLSFGETESAYSGDSTAKGSIEF